MNEKLIITACFDGSQNINGKNARFLDSITLSDYAFKNFNKEKIINKNTFKFIFLDENILKKYQISLKDDIYSLTQTNNYITVTPSIYVSFNNNVTANAQITINGNNIHINNIYECEVIPISTYVSYNNTLIFIPYIIFILLTAIFILLFLKLLLPNKK